MKFRKDLPESQTAGTYLKLKDQESVTGIFRGNTHEFFSVWENKKAIIVPEGTPGAKFRFRVNFVVKDGTTYVPRIFEQGQTVYEIMAELHEEYNLEQTVVKITRKGTELDTTYTLLPLLKHEISQETMNYLDHMDLLPLDGQKSQKESINKNQDDLPF
jgi:hypothetical protein